MFYTVCLIVKTHRQKTTNALSASHTKSLRLLKWVNVMNFCPLFPWTICPVDILVPGGRNLWRANISGPGGGLFSDYLDVIAQYCALEWHAKLALDCEWQRRHMRYNRKAVPQGLYCSIRMKRFLSVRLITTSVILSCGKFVLGFILCPWRQLFQHNTSEISCNFPLFGV